MAAKIDAAISAVKPGSSCSACVIAGGHDLDTVSAVLDENFDSSTGGPRGTLFVTPGSDLYEQAKLEFETAMVSYFYGLSYFIYHALISMRTLYTFQITDLLTNRTISCE